MPARFTPESETLAFSDFIKLGKVFDLIVRPLKIHYKLFGAIYKLTRAISWGRSDKD